MAAYIGVTLVGYGMVQFGPYSFINDSGPVQKTFDPQLIATNTLLNISYSTGNPKYIFSRYYTSNPGVSFGDTGTSNTTISITNNASIVVYTKSLFYAQLQGDGTITVSNPNNPADNGTTLTVSGYNAIGSAYFEQSAASPPYSLLRCTYTSTVAGYSFNKWLGSGVVNSPTSNPGTYYYTVLGGSNSSTDPLICVTNVALTVGQQGGSGAVTSSPAGISTSDLITSVTRSFLYGTNIRLTPTPALHTSFLYWITSSGTQQTRTISLVLTAPTTITAVFGANVLQPILLDYSPSQSERADAMHICECPCACACARVFTSALNRSRQIRALISGSCCMHIPVSAVCDISGSGYTPGTILQLQGGVPLQKSALFKVVSVNSSGGISTIEPLYGQPYRIKPTTSVMTVYSGSGSGASFIITWENCPYPANLYRN